MLENLQEYGVSPEWLIPVAILIGLGVFLLILWITLPFAVFGTKSLLRQLLGEAREMNRRLQKLEEEQTTLRRSLPLLTANPLRRPEPDAPRPSEGLPEKEET